MGGCCCCSSRGTNLNGSPVYYYYPQSLEEREPLSSFSGVTSIGLLVDTNLDTSTPDTYRAPPVPIPYDRDLGRPQTPPDQDSGGRKIDGAAVESIESTQVAGVTISNEGMKGSPDCKGELNSLHSSPKEFDDESLKVSKSIAVVVEEEDCPICLEEYDEENPRNISKCEHHFHLACILEWMERSDNCPVCDQEMIFKHTNIM